MTRLFALAVAVSMMAYLWYWLARGRHALPKEQKPAKPKKKKKLKPGEMWVQVFETVSREEAQNIQMRLEEEDISATVFEQAKKSIDGSTPAGIGVVVPKEQSTYAQQLIFRYLEHLDGEGKRQA